MTLALCKVQDVGLFKLAIFRFNPGQEQKIFPPRHPYFKTKSKKEVKTAIETIANKDIAKNLPGNLTDKEREAIAKNLTVIADSLNISVGEPMTVDQADKQSTNPNYDKQTGYKNNCQTCAPAYMLRLRGIDITAKPKTPGSKLDFLSKGRAFNVWKNADGSPAIHESTNEWMVKKGYKRMTPKRYLEFFNEKTKEVGVYELSIGWKGIGGHATILQRFEDGTLQHIEPQLDNSRNRSLDYLCDNGAALNHPCRGIMRIDNKIFDDSFVDIFDHK